MKISQLKKLLKDIPETEDNKSLLSSIREKIEKVEDKKRDQAKLENSKEFGLLADMIYDLIQTVKNNKVEFPKEIKVSNPVEVKEVTVEVPEEVSVKNLDQIKYPTEIKVTNVPKQKEIKIPDKVEIKNIDKVLSPLVSRIEKLYETYGDPNSIDVSRDNEDRISRITYSFDTVTIYAFITRNRNGKITNIRYTK